MSKFAFWYNNSCHAQLTARARAWQLFLHMISENNKLLHTKNEQLVKIKQRKRQAKPHIYVQSQRLLGKHLFMIMVTTYWVEILGKLWILKIKTKFFDVLSRNSIITGTLVGILWRSNAWNSSIIRWAWLGFEDLKVKHISRLCLSCFAGWQQSISSRCPDFWYMPDLCNFLCL